MSTAQLFQAYTHTHTHKHTHTHTHTRTHTHTNTHTKSRKFLQNHKLSISQLKYFSTQNSLKNTLHFQEHVNLFQVVTKTQGFEDKISGVGFHWAR